jgi:hypothetical protein
MALWHVRASSCHKLKDHSRQTLKPTANLKPTTNGWIGSPSWTTETGFHYIAQILLSQPLQARAIKVWPLPYFFLCFTDRFPSIVTTPVSCPSSKFREQFQIHIQSSPKLLQLWRSVPKPGPEGDKSRKCSLLPTPLKELQDYGRHPHRRHV